jgi:hypothetical protein
MLGEMINEEWGKITGIRVLPSDGEAPKVEASFQASGKLLGIETTDMGTYHSTLLPNGTMRGTGQGVVMTRAGETATWTGEGVGKPTGQAMAASWRGAIYFRTSSPSLTRLNGIAVLFEYDVDAEGNTHSKNWEWK